MAASTLSPNGKMQKMMFTKNIFATSIFISSRCSQIVMEWRSFPRYSREWLLMISAMETVFWRQKPLSTRVYKYQLCWFNFLPRFFAAAWFDQNLLKNNAQTNKKAICCCILIIGQLLSEKFLLLVETLN